MPFSYLQVFQSVRLSRSRTLITINPAISLSALRASRRTDTPALALQPPSFKSALALSKSPSQNESFDFVACDEIHALQGWLSIELTDIDGFSSDARLLSRCHSSGQRRRPIPDALDSTLAMDQLPFQPSTSALYHASCENENAISSAASRISSAIVIR